MYGAPRMIKSVAKFARIFPTHALVEYASRAYAKPIGKKILKDSGNYNEKIQKAEIVKEGSKLRLYQRVSRRSSTP